MSKNMGGGCVPMVFSFLAILALISITDSGSSLLGTDFDFGTSVLIFVAVMVLGGMAQAISKSTAERSQPKRDIKALDPGKPFILFLRPFSSERTVNVPNPHYSGNVLLPGFHGEPSQVPLERLFAQAVEPEFQMRVIGGDPVGPGVIKTSDDAWKTMFQDLAGKAKAILVLVMPGDELVWECETLHHLNLLSKTGFLQMGKDYSSGSVPKATAFFDSLAKLGLTFPKAQIQTQVLCFNPELPEPSRTGYPLETFRYKHIRQTLAQSLSLPF